MVFLKKILYSLGKLFGLFGLIFVFWKLSQEYTLYTFFEKLNVLKYSLIYLFAINYFSLLLGIFAWHIMLLNYAKKDFSFLVSYFYFAQTEIAKYLPGNIFHLVGRQVLASKLNISQSEMARISILFSLLLLVGTIISSTFFAIFTDQLSSYILISMILSSFIVMISMQFFYPTFSMKKKYYLNIILATSISLQGIMLGIIVILQVDTFTTSLFFECASIYIVSWLVGFVTPGASGGLGVREGTFVMITSFLHLNLSSEIIVFSVLLLRLINIFVDITAYLSTLILKKKIQEIN